MTFSACCKTPPQGAIPCCERGDCPRAFEGLRDCLAAHDTEGIVFWLDCESMCKIKNEP